MSGSLSELLVNISADSAQFRTELNKVNKELKSFSTKAGEAQKNLEQTFSIKAIKAVVSDLFHFVAAGAEAAEQMGKLAEQTGISVEEMSRLSYAANLSESSTEELSTGINRLNKNLAEAANGNKKAGAAFEAMGISVTNTDGTLRKAGDVLLDVADKFASYEDGAGKSALAQEAFGRGGLKLIPLLNQGSAAIREMGDESQRLAGVLNDETAKAGDQFGDDLYRLEFAIKGVAIQSAANLSPALDELTKIFFDTTAKSDGFASSVDVVTTGLRIVASAGLEVAKIFTNVGAGIGAIGAQAVAIFAGDFDQVEEISRLRNADLLAADAAFAKSWKAIWEDASKAKAEFVGPPKELMQPPKQRDPGKDSALKKWQTEQKKIADDGARAVEALTNENARLAEALELGGDASATARAQYSLLNGTLRETAEKAAAAGIAFEADEQIRKNLALVKATDDYAKSIAEMTALQDARLASFDKWNDVQRESAEITEASKTNTQKLADAIAHLNEVQAQAPLTAEAYAARLKALKEQFAETTPEALYFRDATMSVLDVLEENALDGFKDGLKGLGDDFANLLKRMLLDAAKAKIAEAIFGGGASLLGLSGHNFSGESALAGPPALATGGYALAGEPYIVGERGPELFVPNYSGTVMPNHALRGGAGPSRTDHYHHHSFDRGDQHRMLGDWMQGHLADEKAGRRR